VAASPVPSRSWLGRILLTPNESRLRAGWRLVAHFMLLIVFFILGTFLSTPILTGSPQLANLIGQVVTLIAITLATFIARRWVDHRSIPSLGLTWNGQSVKDLLVGIALPGLVMGIIFLAEWSLGWLNVKNLAWNSVSPITLLRDLLIMFLVFVAVGWEEELLARGYWLQNLEEGLRLPAALVVSSTMFALGHLANPNVTIWSILGLIVAGLFLAYGYLSTRQLWLPIGLHIGWNFFEGTVFGFPVSGTTNFFTLIESTRTGPELLTGGLFGPEAGLIQYPVLLFAAWLIYLYSRNRLRT
jgi:uncharacterized protein